MDTTTCVIYNIFEFASLDDVFVPLRNTARVKYTCFDVSKKFLFIGANSGSLYVFLRNPLQYLRVLSNKEGPLIFICIAPHDQYVAFATSKGVVVLLEHNVSNVVRVGRSGTPTLTPRSLHVSREHQGAIITALTWNDSGTVLFIADDNGKITSVTVNTPSKKTKALFQESTAMIAHLDSKIVQMDFALSKLLVSTLKTCYLCDTQKEQYSQIGSKPRAGEFGACFYNKLADQMPCIYAARPGSRLWEVDYEGSVLCTHQFKQALAQKPVPIVSVREQFFSGKIDTSPVPNSINFPRLLIVGQRFLLTWVKHKLVLIDPGSMMVLLGARFSKDIQDIKVSAKKLYLWFIDGRFRCFRLLTVDAGISKLLSHSCWKLSASVCDFYKATVISASSRQLLPKHLLENLVTHLSRSDEKELKKAMEDLVASLEELPFEFEKAHTDKDQFNYHIESGIYIINRPKTDPKQLSPSHDSSSSGSPPTISRKMDSETTSSNESTMVDKCTGSSIGNKLNDAAKLRCESKSQNLIIRPNKPSSRRDGDFMNSQSGIVQSDSKAIKKSSSNIDMQSYKGGKQGMSHGSSLESFYYGYPMIHVPMPFISGALWDVEPTSLAALYPSAALDGLRNSLTSKYKSGKESILGKIGILEDHLKSIVIDDPQELLDVPNANNRTSYPDLQHSYEETICTNVSPILKIDVKPLINATEDTLAATYDPSIISRISDEKQNLEGWVSVLLTTQELVYCTLYSQRNNAELTNTRNPSKMNQSKSCINVPKETFANYCSKTRSKVQLCSPKNDFRRKSWPNASCDKDFSNACPVYKETQLTIGSEPQKNICKSCPSALGNTAICGQCIDQVPRQASPSLKLEDILWWYDMRLLDENPVMQIKDAQESQCLLCHPTIFTKDPWGLRLDEHKLVSQLAMVCFKTRTFNRIWKYSADFACFRRIANLEQEEQTSETHDTLRFMPNTIGMENDNLVLDHARAIFVTQFFHLLDTKEIFQELHHDKGSTFQTWRAILIGLIKIVANGCNEFKSFSPLLSALSCQPQDFSLIINTLLSERDSFLARDVLYVAQLRQHHACKLFLEYMDAICESKSHSNEIPRGLKLTSCTTYQDICEDPVVHLAWLTYLLQDGLHSSLREINCVCGKPRPWAHLLHWKRTDLLLQIIRLNLTYHLACLQLCEKFGFWLGYLYLCRGLGKRQEGLAILVQLGDITLFGDHFNIALVPQTTEEWRAVLHLIAQKENRKNCCIFCEAILTEHSGSDDMVKENISLESVTPFLLKNHGPETTLNLFKEIMDDFPDLKLSTSFYWQCIDAAMLNQQEKNMAIGSSNPMKDVLLSQKNYASPQIRSHLIKEVQKCRLEKPEPPTINRCPFHEDFPCHWGINIDLNSLCHTCSLPLALPLASAHEGGIRMFPCGHAFHLQCITSKTCPKC